MCRMLLLKGDFRADIHGIFRTIQLASEKDPFPDPEYNNEHHTHSDGWGYSLFSNGNIGYSRFHEPIFQSSLPIIENGLLMIHSRKTSDDQPKGVLNNHPFVKSTKDSQIYLSHNGWVDKFSLNSAFDEKSLENITDSEAFLEYIAGKTPNSEDELRSIFEGLKKEGVEYSLLNVFITIVTRTGGSPQSFYFTDKGAKGHGYTDFDRLYYVESSKWKGVFSSSLLEFDEFPEYDMKEEVVRGRLFNLQ